MLILTFPLQSRADELEALMQQVEREATGKAPAGGGQGVMVSITTGETAERRAAIWDAKVYVTDPAVRGKLEEFIRTAAPEIASPSVVVLGQQKVIASRPVLEAALAHKSSYVAESAAYALGLMGDRAALDALRRSLPATPGLKRWVFEDAIAQLSGVATRPSPHRGTLQNAGVFCFGFSVDQVREEWRAMIDRHNLRVFATPGGDLNPDMHLYGGAPRTDQFFSLLADEDGKPKLDIVFISDMLPHEFPYELQWRLFQFVRRGGCVVVLGDSFFMSGEIGPRTPRAVHVYRYRPDLWDTLLPRPLTPDFKPFAAGIRREGLVSAARQVGTGRVVHLTAPTPHNGGARGWARSLQPEHIENIVRYAIDGDAAFPALVELQRHPASARAGESLALKLGAFSGGCDDGELTLRLHGDQPDTPPVASSSIPVRLGGKPYASLSASLATDWSLPDGEYRLSATFQNRVGKADDAASVRIESPLRLDWKFPEFYADAGGTLTGELSIDSQHTSPIGDASVLLEVIDGHRRTLQQSRTTITIQPGKNAPIPLRLEARDYPLDSYHLVLRIEHQGKTLNRAARLLHRTGPYDFGPDLAYVPWSGLDPRSGERARKLMEDSGFNGLRTMDPLPGWWAWSLTEPSVLLYDTWPGDLVMNTGVRGGGKMAEWGELFRDRFPRWGTIDHWDEGQSNVHESERGDIAPAASAFYRHWLMVKYGTIDKLNDAWREHYKTFSTSTKIPMSLRIPPARPWEGDLSSWNQVWLYRGSPKDWSEFADEMWWRALGQCHDLFMRTNRQRNPWHWHTVTHQRIYATETPGTLAWQTHNERARYGSLPSTIMIHCLQGEKGNDLYERFHWAALAGGARHMIVWDVSLAQTGTFGYNANWTIWNSDYTMKWWWRPAAESIKRVRTREQVLVDATNAMSSQVAILYHGGNEAPRALFDALYFAGILPEAINPSATRSQRLDLSPLRVIFRVGKDELPVGWKEKLETWQRGGGTLIDTHTLDLPEYAGKLVDAEKGIQYWTGSDTTRLVSRRFVEHQRRVLALLREKGVEPAVSVLDDQGDPAAHVEPVLLTTRDGTQSYLLAACDAGVMGSQAFGKLDEWPPGAGTRIMLDAGLAHGATFRIDGPPATNPSDAATRRFHVWLHAASDAPVDAKITVDDKGPARFRDYIDAPRVVVDRPAAGPRWVAGPVFSLAPGEHRIKIESRDKSAAIDRVLILDSPMIQPRMRVRLPGIAAVHDVYNQRELPRLGDDFLMTMRQARGEVYALITEDLADLVVEPRWIESVSDRRLQLKIEVRRKDGQLSKCRHSFNVSALDAQGAPIAHATTKGSVLGWGVLEIFASPRDPPLPWTVRVEDLTTGKVATARVESRASEAFAQRHPLPAMECKVEPLPPLDGHVNVVPFRVTVVNRGDKPLRGKARVDLPAAWMIDGQTERVMEVPAGASVTVTWEAVMGREQALPLMNSARAPVVVIEFDDGRRWRGVFEDVWMLAWDRKPPRVTDLATGEVEVTVCNYLNRKLVASLSAEVSQGWLLRSAGQAVELDPAAAATDRPAAGLAVTPGAWKFGTVLDAMAAIAPGVRRVPLRVRIGDKTFAGGTRLVQFEKRRTWHIADKTPMEGLEKSGPWTPPIPAKPVDAMKERLWGMAWKAWESDTLLNFPGEIGKPVFGVAHARFARDGQISLRVRGQEHATVWLGGKQLVCGAEPKRAGSAADDLDAISAEKSVKVTAGAWLTLVVRLERQTAVPLADLIFLDEQGKQVWDVTVRATPE